MDEKQREQIALFRYGLIAPMLQGGVNDRTAYLGEAAGRVYQLPGHGDVEYSPKTIENWYRVYIEHGFDALKPKKRSDAGTSRVIDPGLRQRLIELREQQPDISVTLFYEKLCESGAVSNKQASYSSVYRLLKRLDMAGNRQRREPERKRFQFEKINQLWQADLCQGPYLRLGKRKAETHLFAFIDDASRLVPYAAFSTDQTFDSLKMVLKEALLRRGIPSVLYSDNGKIYRSQQLQWVCASLRIALVHTRPYDPAAKGKIERFFLTVRQRFIQALEQSALCSLDSLNSSFHAWLERDYNNKQHSAIAMSPMEFYLSQAHSLKMLDDPCMLEPLFLRREHRKVRHDATISIRNALYEAPARFIGQSVEVRFDPSDPSEAFIYENGSQAARMTPVNLLDNARVKRDASL
jgi:transposase InsO family protein